jgi:hypothetical protein
MKENDATVLRAGIGTLAIDLRRIVRVPKDVKQAFERNLRRIVLYFHHFGVAGTVSTHVFVGGIQHLAAFIADGGINHALQLTKGSFDAPEAAGAKCSFACHNFIVARKKEAVSLMDVTRDSERFGLALIV